MSPRRSRPCPWPGALAALALGLAATAPVVAQDRIDIERGAQVIGNRELPKVLYIVPWKKPLPGEAAGRPPASVLDEALAPLDREVFRRQLQYAPPATAAAPAAAPPAAPAPR